jgi:hypothetical protein
VTLRRLVKTRILRDYNTYVSQVENSLRKDPKMFWSYVHDRNSETRIPAKMTYSDVSCGRPQDIVNSFADYFMSVYSASSVPGNIKPKSYSNSFWPCLTLKKFDKSDIEKAFEQLKPKISYGSDNIPAFLVKDCRSVFLEPLVHIFNLSLEQGTFPKVWKSTKVLPVHKAGNSAEIKNYRPIALLSTFSKVFEIVIFNFLSPVLKNILTPSQHGFMKGQFTVTNLVCVTQFISDSLDRRGQVDDFQRSGCTGFSWTGFCLTSLEESNSFRIMVFPQGNIFRCPVFPKVQFWVHYFSTSILTILLLT